MDIYQRDIVQESVIMYAVLKRILKIILLVLTFIILPHNQASSAQPPLYIIQHRDRKHPPRYYNYPDKYDYGFDPVPPNIKIAPGFRPNHSWRIGGMYYGKYGYSPGYWGTLWLGYEITW